MKKFRLKGAICGVTFGESAPEKWRVRLTEDGPAGREGEIISVQKATVMGGEIEVEMEA